jgi:uncharacterized membrane protein YfhO
MEHNAYSHKTKHFLLSLLKQFFSVLLFSFLCVCVCVLFSVVSTIKSMPKCKTAIKAVDILCWFVCVCVCVCASVIVPSFYFLFGECSLCIK